MLKINTSRILLGTYSLALSSFLAISILKVMALILFPKKYTFFNLVLLLSFYLFIKLPATFFKVTFYD